MNLKRFVTVLFAAILMLAGCQMGNNDGATRDDQGTIDQTRTTRGDGTWDDRNFTQNVENRNRSTSDRANRNSNRNSENRFEVSEEAARKIVDEVNEIDQAYVLTTQNNAYVAATLDENNDNKSQNRNSSNNRNYNDTSKIGPTDGNNTSNSGRTGTNQNRDNNIREDDNMTNRNETINNVRNRMTEDDDLTDEVKNKIADIVRDVDSSIDNVYVTTSPDFFGLTNDYVNDFNDGRPIEGFFDQIGNMIERVFPQNKR